MPAALIPIAIATAGAGAIATGVGAYKQSSAASAAAQRNETGGNTGMGYNKIPAAAPTSLFPQAQADFVKQLGGLSAPTSATMNEMITTGAPTDVGPAFQALQAAMKQQTDIGRANILEQFGASGNRYGSDTMQGLASYEEQSGKDFMSILADYTMKAQEAAAGRRLNASEFVSSEMSTLATSFAPSEYIAPVNASSAGAGGGWAGFGQSSNQMSQMMMMLALLNKMGSGERG